MKECFNSNQRLSIIIAIGFLILFIFVLSACTVDAAKNQNQAITDTYTIVAQEEHGAFSFDTFMDNDSGILYLCVYNSASTCGGVGISVCPLYNSDGTLKRYDDNIK